MKKRNNHVQYRYYIKGELKVLSHMVIASGEDEIADLQIVRDWDGHIMIPGTTLAGNIRHCLAANVKDIKTIDAVFGSADDMSGQSLISFFDAAAISVTTDIRDGIKIDNITKTTQDKSKYNYEIINRGSTFQFRMEAVSRKKTDNNKLEALLTEIIHILENGECRIGAKTSRGLGKIKLSETKKLKLDMSNSEDIKKWIDFSWDDLNSDDSFECQSDLFQKPDVFHITAAFTIPDSLLIKSYSTDIGDVDAVSLTSGGIPVVPGTSWNGAIRHALENAGRELGKHGEMLKLIQGAFGDESPIPSKVVIEESDIEDDWMMMPYVRNKVDRFTGGVVNSALFDEKSVYGGSIQLACKIKNPEDYEKGMLILAIKELQNGIQTVGGGSNIGRGRLEEKAPFSISDDDPQKLLNALAEKLNEMPSDENEDGEKSQIESVEMNGEEMKNENGL